MEPKHTTDRDLYERAKGIAYQYRVIVEPLAGQDGFLARSIELPLVVADGKTARECFDQVRHQMVLAVVALMRIDRDPPKPASERVLDQQVNFRSSSEEKALMELKAKQLGFRGISDYVRSLVLQSLSS